MPVEASVLAAADWSVRPEKRVVAIARSVGDGRHRLEHVEPAGEPGSLVDRLLRLAPAGRGVLLGLDLPIGLPAAYSARAGITSFREAVRRFGSGAWSEFYEISDRPTIHRPFYPPPSRIAGERRRAVLLDGLHCGRPEELLRACDRARPGRTAAESVFWTLGGRQDRSAGSPRRALALRRRTRAAGRRETTHGCRGLPGRGRGPARRAGRCGFGTE